MTVTNPKAILGPVMEYCILVAITGSARLSNISANDALPITFAYVAGTMTSATSCAGATTAEDDNNIGSDETDSFNASINETTLTATASTLTASIGFAGKFRGTVN